jgi:hypothetical protein
MGLSAHVSAGRPPMSCFTGLGRCHEPRGEIDRIAVHCVVLRVGTSERARDNLTTGNSHVRLQRTRCLRA